MQPSAAEGLHVMSAGAAPAVFAKLGVATVHLPELARQVGENVQGRPGGAVAYP